MPSLRDRILVQLARKSWRFAQRVTFDVRTDPDDGGLIIPIYRGVGLENLCDYERWMRPAIRRAFASNDGTFVDVGTNVGQTLLSLLRVSRDIRYVGFEPNVQSCAYLASLIRANALGRHQVVPVGAAEQRSSTELMLGNDFDVSASVVPGFRPRGFFGSSTTVMLEPGDEILERLDARPVRMIKVDVEGAEVEALRGLTGTIERDRPPLVVEVLGHKHLLEREVFPDTPREEIEEIISFRSGRTRMLEALLRELRYETSLMNPDGSWVRVGGLEAPDARVESNFLLMPAERAPEWYE